MPETIFLFVYKLQEGCPYRHDQVFIVGGEETREGLTASQLPTAMARLVDFANQNDNLNELHKAAILHFALAYYHPYFGGNGRTARLFHLWYLVQHGYPAALFTPFSHYIAESKAAHLEPVRVGRLKKRFLMRRRGRWHDNRFFRARFFYRRFQFGYMLVMRRIERSAEK